MNSLTITYKENDRTVTYSKELPESPCVHDIFETYLAAYDSFGFQNDIDVIIRNSFFGDKMITWDKDNYIGHEDLGDLNEKFEKTLDALLDDILLDIFGGSKEESKEENWYMGHKY